MTARNNQLARPRGDAASIQENPFTRSFIESGSSAASPQRVRAGGSLALDPSHPIVQTCKY